MNRQENYYALSTIVKKEVRRILRIWPQTLLPPIITTLLYFVVFGRVLGQHIGMIDNISYIHFIVPGLVMMGVITSSYSHSSSSFFGGKFSREIEAMFMSPMSNGIIYAGFLIGGIIRGFIIGTIITIVSLLFLHMTLYSFGSSLFIGLLAAIFFSAAGILNATFANTFDQISIIPSFVLTPLIYLGGVFYSIDMLKGVWRDISYINPITYIIGAFRYSMLGIKDANLWLSIAALLVFIAIIVILQMWLLRRGTGIKT